MFIRHPSGANRELDGNNTPPLPWTLHSCVNVKLWELFHMSYQKGTIHISLRGVEKITQLTYRNLELSQVILHIYLLEVHPIKYNVFLKHTDRPWSSLAETSTNLNTTNKPGKHIYYTCPKNRPMGETLLCSLPSGPRGATQPDPSSLPFSLVGHCHTCAQRTLSNANGTVTDRRSALAQLDFKASPKKHDLEHFPSSPAIYTPQTSRSKAKQGGSKVTRHGQVDKLLQQ